MTTHGLIYQMVKEEIIRIDGEYTRNPYPAWLDKIDILKKILPKIQELEPVWISVEERLPEIFGKYWVCIDIDGEVISEVLYFSRRSKLNDGFESFNGHIYKAICWQPLPLPPTK